MDIWIWNVFDNDSSSLMLSRNSFVSSKSETNKDKTFRRTTHTPSITHMPILANKASNLIIRISIPRCLVISSAFHVDAKPNRPTNHASSTASPVSGVARTTRLHTKREEQFAIKTKFRQNGAIASRVKRLDVSLGDYQEKNSRKPALGKRRSRR